MILNDHDVYVLKKIMQSVSHIEGSTAEIGVYKGETTKLIIETLPNRNRNLTERPAELNRNLTERPAELNRNLTERTAELNRNLTERTAELNRNLTERPAELNHYCYDTFSGIVCAGENDNHKDGEFSCSLEEVKRNIGTSAAAAAATQIKYCVGLFPDTFSTVAPDEKFSFVYSDTATYFGAKHTLLCFVPHMAPGGKIVFYTDHNTQGVEKAINDYLSHTSMRCTQISNFQIIHIV
jgi:hypothetical protein